MTCYMDRTFCPYHESCLSGTLCARALTPAIQASARQWWGEDHAPIAVYTDHPDCYVDKEKFDALR